MKYFLIAFVLMVTFTETASLKFTDGEKLDYLLQTYGGNLSGAGMVSNQFIGVRTVGRSAELFLSVQSKTLT